MKYPNTTFAGQKVSICNRYIELFRKEHQNHPLKGVANALRSEFNVLVDEAYHGHGLIWLHTKWKDVLNGNDRLEFPGVDLDKRLAATANKDEALQAWWAFNKWQREEHDVTVSILLDERHKAMEECRQDKPENGGHNPTLSDFTMVNGRIRLNVPAQNPHNEATNTAFAMRAFESVPNMDDDHREAIFEALFEARRSGAESTHWDSRLDKELVRTNINMPEPPDPQEDLTTWTNVGGYKSITSDEATVINLPRNVDAYLYEDKGVGHIGDFEHLHKWKLTATINGGAGAVWLLSNILDDYRYLQLNEDTLALWFNNTITLNRFFLQSRTGGLSDDSDQFNATLNQQYYSKTGRSSTTAQSFIYDDVDRMSLVDALGITCNTVTYRYIHAVSSFNTGDTFTASFTSGGFDLQEGAVFQAAWARNSNQLIGVSQ